MAGIISKKSEKRMFDRLTFIRSDSMLDRLEGWLPTDSRVVERGERVFIGDHGEPGGTPRARGLTILALCGRLSFMTVVMMAKVVLNG